MLAVLPDENLDATAIYEATRADVILALTTPGSEGTDGAQRPRRVEVPLDRPAPVEEK